MIELSEAATRAGGGIGREIFAGAGAEVAGALAGGLAALGVDSNTAPHSVHRSASSDTREPQIGHT